MAVTLYRDLAYLGAVKQSALGSPGAPTKFFVLQNCAFIPSPKVTDFRTGNQRDIGFSVKEEWLYKGAFKTFLYADEGAALFAWLMGKDTKTGAGDPWTHTLDLSVDALPYLSFEASYFENGLIDRVQDCKIARLMLESEAGKEAMLTVDLLGGAPARQSSGATVSFSNGASEGPMMMHQAAITLTGPTDASTLQGQVRKVTLVVDPGINPEYGPGVYAPIAQFEQARLITVKLDVLFSGDSIYRLTHFGGTSGTAPSATVGTGAFEIKYTSQASPEHSIDITTGYLNWKNASPTGKVDAKTGIMTIEAVAYKSGSNYPLAVVAKNGFSTAYV